MTTNDLTFIVRPINSRERLSEGSGRMASVAFFGVLLTLSAWTGCTESELPPPPVKVQTVTAYGVTLDEAATPQEVVYVLLRSLADDVRAAQAKERQQQREAVETTFSLAAYSTIEQRLNAMLKASGVNREPRQAKERDRDLFELVNGWAPIAAHYIESFDTDMKTAAARMEVVKRSKEQQVNVYYRVTHDPSEKDPARQQTALMNIELVKEQEGPVSFWRVARVGYINPATTRRPENSKTG